MGKGRPRAVEKGVQGHSSSTSTPSFTLNIPQAPVFYPTEDEFKDPLQFINNIRSVGEQFGICRIVPPKSWKPPFALNLDSFTFPTKSQAIHRLQARSAACDPATFELEYNRFVQKHIGRKPRKKISLVFEGEDLDMCKLFNAVKRYGGYDKVSKEKKWGDVFRFMRPAGKIKITECSKHVLCQLYREHLYDYEVYQCRPVPVKRGKKRKRASRGNSDNVELEGVGGDALDQICEQCRSGLHGDVMLLCDRCNKGWHLYCLSPPLDHVPFGNWYCLECVNLDKDSFGFVPGKRLSLESFSRAAERAKRKWLGSTCAGRSQIEKFFWEIVEGSTGEVEVMYGSDLDTSLYGSGFPRVNDPMPSSLSVESEVWKEYCASPWNLNNLPKLQGSMLRAVHDNIAGVMVPWLYIGMLFSSFCWHFEDHCFYSMNYLHWGEPKCWYSVPGSEARAFEQVMRKTLPDLFDAQPDLLFQLVTMLNPSVLQENGVPVYSVLQEPGNFVITFPRSFHGGFNFGLNCAEAVNFAPADWLPHGGYGADLYRLYHKSAVLSHEELLFVAAKSGCNINAFPYLKEEMLRIFDKEKTSREKLWRNGIIKSSQMLPRTHPEYVGTEEDPTCIICKQYLYLSAVICSCRPSSFVCLEHWERLCECKPSKHRLLYRYTLAEFNDLVLKCSPVTATKNRLEEMPKSGTCHRKLSCSDESNAMTKKVKGGQATHVQLAEDWISSSSLLFQTPFSDSAYISALKQVEQFLWAGHEMDWVRDMTKNLIEAQKWAVAVRNCHSKVDSWLDHHDGDIEKVSFGDVENLLSSNPPPCNVPEHSKLKAYAKDARILVVEMKSALSSCSCVTVAELESLYSRSVELPIHLEESGRLAKAISSAKVWIDRVRECFSERKLNAIDVDVLYKLQNEMSELCVQLPEMELLSDQLRQVKSWQIRCSEILKGPINLKELEVFLQETDYLSVSIPELKLLRQYHCDAMSWISRFEGILVNIQEREDQGKVVEELTCILRAGELLRVQVEELPLVERELRNSRCREKALKALASQMPLEFIQQLLTEAALLGIEKEKIFIDICGVHAAAITWEERAKSLLRSVSQMSELEDVIRTSEKIYVILPSLGGVKDVLSMAKSWIKRSQPFLVSSACSLLKVEDLKDLVKQSKFLKVSLKEPEMVRTILKDVEAWEYDACLLLEHAGSIFNIHVSDIKIDNELTVRIEDLLNRINLATEAGRFLGFEFYEIPKLQDAASTLMWILKALSLCRRAPLLMEVDSLIEDAENLPGTFVCNLFGSALVDGARWLKKALVLMPEHHNPKSCKLEDVEEVLNEVQRIRVQFPMMVARLVNAIEKHKSWQGKVNAFFNSKSGKQSWSLLLQLKELGQCDAFNGPDMDKVVSEIGKIENWMLHCENIVHPSVDGPLLDAIVKIKDTLDRAMCLYRTSKDCRERAFCLCCSSEFEDENVLMCLTCEDRYHLSCVGSPLAGADIAKTFTCPFCLFLASGAISRNGGCPLISRGKRPELKALMGTLHDAQDFCARIEERDMIEKIVELALICKSDLKSAVDHVLAYTDKDFSCVSKRLLISLKAVAVAGVYDHQDSCNLELALTRNSWKTRVKKLFDDSRKPSIHEIERMLKEGLAINIPSKDHFMQELTEMKHVGLQWANCAKKVAFDSGELELIGVFKLIMEGEKLPVHFGKELKLLRDRSVLYCICRKPYDDQRAMIACDHCDEWYHFDCIDLLEPPPKTFLCPACKPVTAECSSLLPSMYHDERSISNEEPQTPPPRHTESKRRRPRKARSSLEQKMLVSSDLSKILRCSSEIDHMWRENRRPFRRMARKRTRFESLSLSLHH